MRGIDVIRDYFEKMRSLYGVDAKERVFFEHYLKDLKEVRCYPAAEVLTKEEISYIKKRVILIPKECYSNALHVSQILAETYADIAYVEGVALAGEVLPISHAFVKVGSKYIDPTFEWVLDKDVEKETYAVLGEWNPDEALRRMAKWGTYGDVYVNSILQDL